MLTRFKDLTADFAKRFLSISVTRGQVFCDEDETQNEVKHFNKTLCERIGGETFFYILAQSRALLVLLDQVYLSLVQQKSL